MKLRRTFAMKKIRKIFATRKRKSYAILLVAILVVGLVFLLSQHASPGRTNIPGNSSSPVSNGLATTARYTVNSPPTGQWLVVDATSPVLSVSASNTGTIPGFSSLASLNQTSIGYACSQAPRGGQCQTGWFWDSAGRLLTVHYLGGANVTLTVVEKR